MDISFDKDFIDLLCVPTSRGKRHGVVGNGAITDAIWTSFHKVCKGEKGELDSDWRDHITQDMMILAKRKYIHYLCPTCHTHQKPWYL